MTHSIFYNTLIHQKHKFGVSDEIFGRFKTYNKGNFSHKPNNVWVVDSGFEEGITLLEDLVFSELYDYLENPEFHDRPTEYVDPKFTHITAEFMKDLIERIIKEHPVLQKTIRRVKDEYVSEATSDPYFLESVRLYPEKYLEDYYK